MAEKKTYLEYPNYEDYDDTEARYQGYDIEDDAGNDFELSVIESEQIKSDSEESDADEDLSDLEDTKDAEESDETGDSDDSDETYQEDEAKPDTYEINGHVYKDLRDYVSALYRMDVSHHQQLDEEEQIELGRIIRRGMLCDCSIMPEDPKVPEEYPYKLVDKTSRVLRRLKQTKEEKAWVESLTEDELHRIITEGRAAQEKLVSSTLPLVMAIANIEVNHMEHLDRIQAGNIGLLKAVQYFNPYKEILFSTFAYRMIENEIRDWAAMLSPQKNYPTLPDYYVPTEADIEAVCHRMGGKYWMREVTVDTDQTEDRIRKQIAAMLGQRIFFESIANNIMFGKPHGNDIRLSYSEDDKTAAFLNEKKRSKRKYISNKSQAFYYMPCEEEEPKFNVITGDGKKPKKDEMSAEDFVRLFFKTLNELKTISPWQLAWFVLRDKKTIQKKMETAKRFLAGRQIYSEETAITDLRQLISKGEIWPEYPRLKQAELWGWSGIDSDLRNECRNHYVDYVDSKHPTESAALILYEEQSVERYLSMRRQDIRKDAKISLEYYGWLQEVLRTTADERLTDQNKKIMEDLADGYTYVKLQDKYHINSKQIKKRKYVILYAIYDQTMESSNRENGESLMACLKYQYQKSVLQEWKNRMINKMIHDHYTEKKRFALRSRGDDDYPRPPMEKFHNQITSVINLTSHSVGLAHQFITDTLYPIAEAIRTFLTSDALKDWKDSYEEDEWDSDLDDLEIDEEIK